MTTYREAEQYILEIPRFAGKNTLEDTQKLLKKLHAENTDSKIVHVAGTNGKGSVCAYLSSCLRESKRSCGLFISPHLQSIRERISVDQELISREEFVRAFEKVKAVSTKENHPSFFEFLFLMAMVYFAEKKPEYIILETGLGGRLDATNCVPRKELCIITEIGYDHTQYLGETLPEIAGEKAGILKEGIPLVYINKRQETTKVIEETAKKRHVLTYPVGSYDITEVNTGDKTIDFSLSTGYYKYVSFSIRKTALYQVENASLAIRGAEVLAVKDPRITEETIQKGLLSMYWPGRMDEVLENIYLDGAHNEDGITAFLEAVQNSSCDGKRYLLFSVVADKQYDKMIQKIAVSGLFDEVAVTTLESDRGVSLTTLKESWRQYQIPCHFFENAKDAYQALVLKKKKQDKIYIAGSLYLIGQILSLIRRTPDD